MPQPHRSENESPSGARTDSRSSQRVAVVGAGLSGLVCAGALSESGHQVVVFEKARGPGGRMSTRRAEALRFDHGAQYFTARDPKFQAVVARWVQVGLVESWTANIVELRQGDVGRKPSEIDRFVGVPGMNALCKDLAGSLDVRYQVRVQTLLRTGVEWFLQSDDEVSLGAFDAVVITAPAPQTAAMLAEVLPAMAEAVSQVVMDPCWAVMAHWPEPLPLDYDAAFVQDSPLSWVAREGSKPGRPEGASWVLHASPSWSTAQVSRPQDEAARALLAAFEEANGMTLPPPDHLLAHRWLYALPQNPRPEPCLVDRTHRLVLAGDWCGGPRVEGAFLSGTAAAESVQSFGG